MKAVPILEEVAELIGDNAQRVDNRSLILDKFSLSKQWPWKNFHNANSWSLMRIADGGRALLEQQSNACMKDADKQERRNRAAEANVLREQAQIARDLAASQSLAGPDARLSRLNQQRSQHLARQCAQTYGTEHCRLMKGTLKSRMALNLAEGLIENAGACLERLTGEPYIPGSAVKGIARHAALEHLRGVEDHAAQQRCLETFLNVFGYSEVDFTKGELKAFAALLSESMKDKKQRGKVRFLAASVLESAALEVDVTTVHFPEYYRTGEQRDLAKETLRPNAFPVVAAGAAFVFTLICETPEAPALLDAAVQWLTVALTEKGAGAKTAAGYGWFAVEPYAPPPPEPEPIADTPSVPTPPVATPDKLQTPEGEVAAMDDLAFANACNDIDAQSEAVQRAIFAAFAGSRAKRWKKWSKSERNNDKERVRKLRDCATKLGISLQ